MQVSIVGLVIIPESNKFAQYNKLRVIDILINKWQITSMCIHEIMKTQKIEKKKSHQKGKYKSSKNDNTKREKNLV